MPGLETTPLTDPGIFPLWTRETLRFADTDRLGHVNNAVFATFCESGRVAFFYDPAALLVPPGCAVVIARLVLDFRAEMHWPGVAGPRDERGPGACSEGGPAGRRAGSRRSAAAAPARISAPGAGSVGRSLFWRISQPRSSLRSEREFWASPAFPIGHGPAPGPSASRVDRIVLASASLACPETFVGTWGRRTAEAPFGSVPSVAASGQTG